jgi:hypothetical protein
VLHSAVDGLIIAVGQPAPDAEQKFAPIAGRDQGILETQVEEREVKTLHRTHKVDVKKKSLVAAKASGDG